MYSVRSADIAINALHKSGSKEGEQSASIPHLPWQGLECTWVCVPVCVCVSASACVDLSVCVAKI